MSVELSEAQLEALGIYSVDRGADDWKASLLRDWERDDPAWAINDFGWRILRELRETHGPEWLHSFAFRPVSLRAFPDCDPFVEVQWPRSGGNLPQWHAPGLRLAVAQRIWCDEHYHYYLIVAATGQPSLHGGHRGSKDGRFEDLRAAQRACIAEQRRTEVSHECA